MNGKLAAAHARNALAVEKAIDAMTRIERDNQAALTALAPRVFIARVPAAALPAPVPAPAAPAPSQIRALAARASSAIGDNATWRLKRKVVTGVAGFTIQLSPEALLFMSLNVYRNGAD